MNWRDLKEFCNSLPEEELHKKVVILTREGSFNDLETTILEEDHYMSEEEHECYPESEATEPLENLIKVYSKGTPMIVDEFMK